MRTSAEKPPRPAARTMLLETLAAIAACWALGGVAQGEPGQAEAADKPPHLRVEAFLPAGFVRDGSVSYQGEVQRAIDAAAEAGGVLAFPPIVYFDCFRCAGC